MPTEPPVCEVCGAEVEFARPIRLWVHKHPFDMVTQRSRPGHMAATTSVPMSDVDREAAVQRVIDAARVVVAAPRLRHCDEYSDIHDLETALNALKTLTSTS